MRQWRGWSWRGLGMIPAIFGLAAGGALAATPPVSVYDDPVLVSGDYQGAYRDTADTRALCLQRATEAACSGQLPRLSLIATLAGHADEGERLARSGIKASGARDAARGDAAHALGVALDGQRRFTEARQAFETARTVRTAVLGAGHPDTLETVNDLANVLDTLQAFAEARVLRARVLEGREALYGARHRKTVEARFGLALSQLQDQPADAVLVALQPVLADAIASNGADHPEVASVHGGLAMVYDRAGRHDEAAMHEYRALQIRRKRLGDSHPLTLAALQSLAGYAVNGKQIEMADHVHRLLKVVGPPAWGEQSPAQAAWLVDAGHVLLRTRSATEALMQMGYQAWRFRNGEAPGQPPEALVGACGAFEQAAGVMRQQKTSDPTVLVSALEASAFCRTQFIMAGYQVALDGGVGTALDIMPARRHYYFEPDGRYIVPAPKQAAPVQAPSPTPAATRAMTPEQAREEAIRRYEQDKRAAMVRSRPTITLDMAELATLSDVDGDPRLVERLRSDVLPMTRSIVAERRRTLPGGHPALAAALGLDAMIRLRGLGDPAGALTSLRSAAEGAQRLAQAGKGDADGVWLDRRRPVFRWQVEAAWRLAAQE